MDDLYSDKIFAVKDVSSSVSMCSVCLADPSGTSMSCCEHQATPYVQQTGAGSQFNCVRTSSHAQEGEGRQRRRARERKRTKTGPESRQSTGLPYCLLQISTIPSQVFRSLSVRRTVTGPSVEFILGHHRREVSSPTLEFICLTQNLDVVCGAE